MRNVNESKKMSFCCQRKNPTWQWIVHDSSRYVSCTNSEIYSLPVINMPKKSFLHGRTPGLASRRPPRQAGRTPSLLSFPEDCSIQSALQSAVHRWNDNKSWGMFWTFLNTQTSMLASRFEPSSQTTHGLHGFWSLKALRLSVKVDHLWAI